MSDKRILYVNQEIAPYVAANPLSQFSKELPVALHKKGYEVRTFMPKFGSVNERRNQLHEVIRLSGINIIINDNDHPLIIKVASMQPSRIQVYFVDNDDYFQKLDTDVDAIGSNRADNDERIIFYSRGTMETVKKLRWDPKILHCSGAASMLVPLYMRKNYSDDPSLKNTKIVVSVTPRRECAPLNPEFFNKLKDDGFSDEDFENVKHLPLDETLLTAMALEAADGVIFNGCEPDPEYLAIIERRGIPCIQAPLDSIDADTYLDFYTTVSAAE